MSKKELQKKIEELKRKVNCAVDDLRNIGMRFELETFRANRLQDELKSQPAEIVEKIKEQLIKRLNTIAGYGRMTTDELSFLIEAEFSSDLDAILKEYQK